MQLKQSILTLAITLFSMNSALVAGDSFPVADTACNSVLTLNRTLQAKLELTNSQINELLRYNLSYWRSRNEIIDSPQFIAKNTAVLACWYDWKETLAEHLSEDQMEKFLQWQSEVDLLSESPY